MGVCWKSSMSQLNQAVPSDLFCESLTSQLGQAVPRRCRSRGGYLGCLAIIAKFMIRRAASSRNSCLVCNKALVLLFLWRASCFAHVDHCSSQNVRTCGGDSVATTAEGCSSFGFLFLSCVVTSHCFGALDPLPFCGHRVTCLLEL